MLVLFASFTLALSAAFVYAVNLTLLPTEPDAIHAVARNRCIERFKPETKNWERCLREEPTAPSDDAKPFLVAAAWSAGGGLLLTIAANRARLVTLLTAIVLAGLLAIGTAEAVRNVDEERERIAQLRASPTPEPTPVEGG